MDNNKKEQAINIIATEINKLPENTPMDHGTVGALQGLTMREGQAYNMALYVVKQMGGTFTGTLPENYSEAESESVALAEEISTSVIAITGK